MSTTRRPALPIIAASVALWSAFTAACGLAQNFWQLFLARMGVGIGEAGCSPPAMSMLADFYPRTERGRAMGIYALGLLPGLFFGGTLSEAEVEAPGGSDIGYETHFSFC